MGPQCHVALPQPRTYPTLCPRPLPQIAHKWPAIEVVMRLSGVKRTRWAGLVDDLMVIQEAVLVADAAKQQG